MSAERPFRHLCPEADMRDAMTDDELEAHVADYLSDPDDAPADDEPDWDWDDLSCRIDLDPCPVCGEAGPCAYDSEGRALIHATDPSEVL